MNNNEWWFIESLEGPALILGPGFDYKAAIHLDIANGHLIIRSPYPSRETDENYPYPNEMELAVPVSQIQELLAKKTSNEKDES